MDLQFILKEKKNKKVKTNCFSIFRIGSQQLFDSLLQFWR